MISKIISQRTNQNKAIRQGKDIIRNYEMSKWIGNKNRLKNEIPIRNKKSPMKEVKEEESNIDFNKVYERNKQLNSFAESVFKMWDQKN